MRLKSRGWRVEGMRDESKKRRLEGDGGRKEGKKEGRISQAHWRGFWLLDYSTICICPLRRPHRGVAREREQECMYGLDLMTIFACMPRPRPTVISPKIRDRRIILSPFPFPSPSPSPWHPPRSYLSNRPCHYPNSASTACTAATSPSRP